MYKKKRDHVCIKKNKKQGISAKDKLSERLIKEIFRKKCLWHMFSLTSCKMDGFVFLFDFTVEKFIPNIQHRQALVNAN